MPKAAILILNWNGRAHLEHFLPSIVKHCPKDAEVIVADNGSTDDSVAFLHTNFPAVRLIQLDRNYGFAEGNNRAIAQLDTPYVLLLNSDVKVHTDFLSPMIAYMDAHP